MTFRLWSLTAFCDPANGDRHSSTVMEGTERADLPCRRIRLGRAPPYCSEFNDQYAAGSTPTHP